MISWGDCFVNNSLVFRLHNTFVNTIFHFKTDLDILVTMIDVIKISQIINVYMFLEYYY